MVTRKYKWFGLATFFMLMILTLSACGNETALTKQNQYDQVKSSNQMIWGSKPIPDCLD